MYCAVIKPAGNGLVLGTMIMSTKIDLHYENTEGVGIFSLSGELSGDQEDDLKMVLMRALYSTERAVINFKDVSKIDHSCMKLLQNAYCTSIRLRSPIIMTGIPQEYAERILKCDEKQHRDFRLVTDHALNFTENKLKRF